MGPMLARSPRDGPAIVMLPARWLLHAQDPGTLAHTLQMTAFQSVQQKAPAMEVERALSVDSLDSPAMAAAMAESVAAG